MYAVIYRTRPDSAPGRYDIAGRPLLGRQLQWLKSLGVSAIAVELGHDEDSLELADWLSEGDALGFEVMQVLSDGMLGAAGVIARAGWAKRKCIALRDDVLASSDPIHLFTTSRSSVMGRLETPPGVKGNAGGMELVVPGSGSVQLVTLSGWGVRVDGPERALALSTLVLERRLGSEADAWQVPVHAHEQRPGVWVARGAIVDPDAEIIAPVYIGRDAVVCAGAKLGPNVIVGDRAVVDSGARVSEAVLGAGSVIGERARFSGVTIAPDGEVEDVDSRISQLVPKFEVDSRDEPSVAGYRARVAALLLATVLLPLVALEWLRRSLLRERWSAARLAAAADFAERLMAVVNGRLALVGVSGDITYSALASPSLIRQAARAPEGAIHIDAALVDEDTSDTGVLRARAWYAEEKSPAVDWKLVRRLLRTRRQAAGTPVEVAS